MTHNRRLRGTTLVEVVMAAGLTSLVILTSMAILTFGYYTWLKGSAHVMAEADSELAVQATVRQLREAMSVTVDANGEGCTYHLPAKSGSGSYAIPLVWDNVTRRIALNGTELVMTGSDGSSETLARSIMSTDPASTAASPYKIFTSSVGQTTFVTVMLVTSQLDGQQNLITSRSREAVFLRNIPRAAN